MADKNRGRSVGDDDDRPEDVDDELEALDDETDEADDDADDDDADDDDDLDDDDDDLTEEESAARAEKREARKAKAKDAKVSAGAVARSRSKDGKPRGGIFGRFGRFVREIFAELQKVIWPTRKELLTYTTVVVVFVAIMMTIVALLDVGFAQAMFWVFGNTTTTGETVGS